MKVRYRGLEENANRLFATCALVNLFFVRSSGPHSSHSITWQAMFENECHQSQRPLKDSL